MYRNMAVSTSKIYLAWQNRDEQAADDCGDPPRPRNLTDRNPCTTVNLVELDATVKLAVMVSRSTVAGSFRAADGVPLDDALCSWCRDMDADWRCPYDAPPNADLAADAAGSGTAGTLAGATASDARAIADATPGNDSVRDASAR